MGSSPLLLPRQRPVHEILGGGLVADVMLWRRSNVTICILLVWAKAAAVLNRPVPPIPVLKLTEELADEAKVFVHSHANMILSGFQDMALGKDSKLFYKVAAPLWLISIVSSWTDFLTFGYICLRCCSDCPCGL